MCSRCQRRKNVNPPAAAFVISLDFELLWGNRVYATKETYGRNVLGGRQAIPRMLDLFERHNIHATWATVGMVFCESKDELMSVAPQLRPTYETARLSNYSYFDDVGRDEKVDPFYFGASLVRSIASCPGQEIGSHTFSHYYCLEKGQTKEQFEADMDAAITVATRRGLGMKSFVFPRNQFSSEHLDILRRKGLRVIRGNEESWIYDATDWKGQTKLRRLVRLMDSYVNLSGHHVCCPSETEAGLVDVPSSRFLRPFVAALAPIDSLRLCRIKASMTQAARVGRVFHLWWHPHNFGTDVDGNMAVLKRIVMHFNILRDQYGMKSMAMGEFV